MCTAQTGEKLCNILQLTARREGMPGSTFLKTRTAAFCALFFLFFFLTKPIYMFWHGGIYRASIPPYVWLCFRLSVAVYTLRSHGLIFSPLEHGSSSLVAVDIIYLRSLSLKFSVKVKPVMLFGLHAHIEVYGTENILWWLKVSG